MKEAETVKADAGAVRGRCWVVPGRETTDASTPTTELLDDYDDCVDDEDFYIIPPELKIQYRRRTEALGLTSTSWSESFSYGTFHRCH